MTEPNKHAELLEALMGIIPYPQHIRDIDLSEPNVIRLEWRGDRFRITEGMVEEIDGSMLARSNKAILFEQLVKLGLIHIYERRAKVDPRDRAARTEAANA